MGKKTGNPRGRPPGAKNKRTREREIALAEAAVKLREVMGDTFDGDAHALMTMLYQDQSLPLELRLDAAKAAAPYTEAEAVRGRAQAVKVAEALRLC